MLLIIGSAARRNRLHHRTWRSVLQVRATCSWRHATRRTVKRSFTVRSGGTCSVSSDSDFDVHRGARRYDGETLVRYRHERALALRLRVAIDHHPGADCVCVYTYSVLSIAYLN
jgi:hypothetical protein